MFQPIYSYADLRLMIDNFFIFIKIEDYLNVFIKNNILLKIIKEKYSNFFFLFKDEKNNIWAILLFFLALEGPVIRRDGGHLIQKKRL